MQEPKVRVTAAVAAVLRVFLDQIDQPHYGYELMRITGFPSGKLYPILARLEAAGWLEKQREQVDANEAGRPPRYLYRISARGAAAARHELAALYQQLRTSPATGTLRPAGGHA